MGYPAGAGRRKGVMEIISVTAISVAASITGVAMAWTAMQMALKAVLVRVNKDR